MHGRRKLGIDGRMSKSRAWQGRCYAVTRPFLRYKPYPSRTQRAKDVCPGTGIRREPLEGHCPEGLGFDEAKERWFFPWDEVGLAISSHRVQIRDLLVHFRVAACIQRIGKTMKLERGEYFRRMPEPSEINDLPRTHLMAMRLAGNPPERSSTAHPPSI